MILDAISFILEHTMWFISGITFVFFVIVGKKIEQKIERMSGYSLNRYQNSDKEIENLKKTIRDLENYLKITPYKEEGYKKK